MNELARKAAEKIGTILVNCQACGGTGTVWHEDVNDNGELTGGTPEPCPCGGYVASVIEWASPIIDAALAEATIERLKHTTIIVSEEFDGIGRQQSFSLTELLRLSARKDLVWRNEDSRVFIEVYAPDEQEIKMLEDKNDQKEKDEKIKRLRKIILDAIEYARVDGDVFLKDSLALELKEEDAK